LKRAHFLLFGESDEGQGVYFGELSGFLARIREAEQIEIPAAFKLSLRADVSGRIDKRDFAIEVEPEELSEEVPFSEMPTGSSDPAKIFVEAVREMREEEEEERLKVQLKLERQERAFDFIDRWKLALGLIPAVVFVAVLAIFLLKVVDFSGPVLRGFPSTCGIEVVFEGGFSDKEIRGVNKGVGDRICGHFEVSNLVVSRSGEGKVEVRVDVLDWMLKYNFVKKNEEQHFKVPAWRIKKYARTPDSDTKSGKVQRDSGSAGNIST